MWDTLFKLDCNGQSKLCVCFQTHWAKQGVPYFVDFQVLVDVLQILTHETDENGFRRVDHHEIRRLNEVSQREIEHYSPYEQGKWKR